MSTYDRQREGLLQLFDVISLLIDLPEDQVPAGTLGTVVELLDDQHFLVEFSAENGHTLALVPLNTSQLKAAR